MYFYFSSRTEVAIKLNGAFLGILGDNSLKIDVENPDKTLVELLPLNQKSPPVQFLLNDSFLSAPLIDITLTDLMGAYAVFVNLPTTTDGFRVIYQDKFDIGLITVFCDQNLKISIENDGKYYIETLPVYDQNVTVKRFNVGEKPFVALILGVEKYHILVYGKNKNDTGFEKFLEGEFCSYAFSPCFTLTKNYLDVKKHQVATTYSFDGEKFNIKDKKILTKKSPPINGYIENIMPYVFLEDLLVGDNIDEYLSQNVLENKNKIKDYLGDFIAVIPPKSHRQLNEVGLLYKKNANIYYVNYFTFDLLNGKICNIVKNEH